MGLFLSALLLTFAMSKTRESNCMGGYMRWRLPSAVQEVCVADMNTDVLCREILRGVYISKWQHFAPSNTCSRTLRCFQPFNRELVHL